MEKNTQHKLSVYHMNNLTSKKINTKKSKTAIICLSPYHGGMEMDAYKMAKMLSDFTEITLIVKKNSFLENRYKTDSEKTNINIETIHFNKNFSFSIIFNARKILITNKIENVIFFGASELKSLYFSFLWLDINLIIRHGTTKGTSKKDLLHKILYRNVNYHIAISNHLAKNVREIIPFGRNSHLKIIYPSLNLPHKTTKIPPHTPDHAITLLHVGRIVDGKGQLDAIKACKILYDTKRKFILNIVGEMEPEYSKELYKYLDTVPYKDSIKIQPFTFNISNFYEQSDIFIFPSKGEGFGNAFMEALSYGLICIAYNNTIFPEFKDKEFEFLLAEDQDIDSLQNTLHDAIKYVESNNKPIIKNIQLSEELFSKEREAREIMETLI